MLKPCKHTLCSYVKQAQMIIHEFYAYMGVWKDDEKPSKTWDKSSPHTVEYRSLLAPKANHANVMIL